MAMKVKGNTLLELVMGMGILALVFVLGMGSHHQLAGIYSSPQRFQTQVILEEMLQAPFSELSPADSVVEWRGREVRRHLKALDAEGSLWEVTVTALWEGRVLGKRRRIGEMIE